MIRIGRDAYIEPVGPDNVNTFMRSERTKAPKRYLVGPDFQANHRFSALGVKKHWRDSPTFGGE